jgi:ABC-2 type transport system permease protein
MARAVNIVARTVLAISWKQSLHTLSRNTWALVGSIIGLLYALGAIAFAFVGAIALRISADPELIVPITLLAAMVAAVLWIIINIFVGVQAPIAPEQFCLLPVRARDLTLGAFLAGICSITGIAFTLVAVTMIVPFTIGLAPTIAALIGLPLALVLWFLVSRTITDALAGQFAGRRMRELIIGVLVLLVASSGLWIQIVVVQPLAQIESGVEFETQLHKTANVLQWIPLAAPVAMPGSVAQGHWFSAVVQLLITLATIAVFWLLWSRMLSSRLTQPVLHQGSRAVRSGKVLDRFIPATPIGAIVVRQLRYMKRDNRQLINLVIALIMPPLMVVLFSMQMTSLSTADDGGAPIDIGAGLPFATLIAVLFTSIIAQFDFAYDGESLAWHIFAGVSGRVDRWARMISKLITVVLFVIIEATIIAIVVGAAAVLPGVLGAVISGCLVALAGGTVLSVWFPGTAPAPGDNPFGRGSSGGIHTLIGMALNMLIVLVVAGAPIGFGIAGIWVPWAGWVSLAGGLVIGTVSLWLAVVISAPLYEKRQAKILEYVSKAG